MSTPTPLYDALVVDGLTLDTITCDLCAADPDWRVTMRCCNDMVACLCEQHMRQVRGDATRFLTNGHRLTCVTCSASIRPGSSFADVYRTVAL